MTSKTKDLLEDALQLPSGEREALAESLLDSLDVDDPKVEAEWQKEIETRIAELDTGKVQPIPWSEARRMIFGDEDDSSAS